MEKHRSVAEQVYRYWLNAVLAIPFTVAIVSVIQKKFSGRIEAFVSILDKFTADNEGAIANLEFILGWLSVLICWGLIFLLLIAAHKFTALHCILAIGVLAAFIYMKMDEEVTQALSIVVMIAGIFYILETLLWVGNILYGEKRETEVFSLLPFVLAAAVIASVLPARTEPVSWKKIIETPLGWIQTLAENFGRNQAIVMGDFSIAACGFNDEDVKNFPGGYLDKGNAILLSVKTYAGMKPDGYYEGCVRNVYTSTGWERQLSMPETFYAQNGAAEYQFRFFENLYYLHQSGIPTEETHKICRFTQSDIQYVNLRTESTLYPSYCWKITPLEEEGYRAYGINMNQEQAALVSYLKGEETVKNSSQDTAYQELVKTIGKQKEIEEILFSDGFQEQLEAYGAIVKNNYLALPESLPKRVYELARQLTKDCESDYEKVMAIKDYIKQFPYTTAAAPTPRTEDFVDYFLFESKEGYCTHFATALAVLSRCADIPSAYVEGVKAEYKEFKEGEYLVRSKEVHAWCEVYLDGYGWFRIEATPGFSEKQSSFRRAQVIQEEEEPEDSIFAQEGDIQEEEPEEGQQKTQKYAIAAASLLLLLSIYIVFRLIRRNIRRKQYQSLDTKEKIFFLMKEILTVLAFAGFEKRMDENLTEYVLRLRGEEGFKRALEQEEFAMEDFAKGMEKYAEIRYDNDKRQVRKETLKYFGAYHARILNIAKNTRGKWKYFLFCIIWKETIKRNIDQKNGSAYNENHDAGHRRRGMRKVK